MTSHTLRRPDNGAGQTIPGELVSPPPQQPQRTEVEQSYLAVRLSFAIATIAVLMVNYAPLTLIQNHITSALKRAAIVTQYPEVMYWMFVVAMAACVPFLLIQVIVPPDALRKWLTRLAVFGFLLASTAWFFLAVLSRDLDHGSYGWGLWGYSFANLAFARVLGMSLNHELVRELLRKERR